MLHLAEAIDGAVSAEVFNWVVGAAATIILALAGAIAALYRQAGKDKDGHIADIKEMATEQKEILKHAVETIAKAGNSVDNQTKALEEVRRALEINTELLRTMEDE